MNDYIKREDAIVAVEKFGGRLNDEVLYEMKSALFTLPPADVIEVRHGRWRDIGKTACQCSECDHLHLGNDAEWTTMLYKYCPNCGARMDGEEE